MVSGCLDRVCYCWGSYTKDRSSGSLPDLCQDVTGHHTGHVVSRTGLVRPIAWVFLTERGVPGWLCHILAGPGPAHLWEPAVPSIHPTSLWVSVAGSLHSLPQLACLAHPQLSASWEKNRIFRGIENIAGEYSQILSSYSSKRCSILVINLQGGLLYHLG